MSTVMQDIPRDRRHLFRVWSYGFRLGETQGEVASVINPQLIFPWRIRFLVLPQPVASKVTVHRIVVGHELVLDSPVPGALFGEAVAARNRISLYDAVVVPGGIITLSLCVHKKTEVCGALVGVAPRRF